MKAAQRPQVVFSALLLGLLALALQANAATTRTVPAPYATIQAAIDAADPGDTIQVAAGTYTENVVIDKPLTLLGANADVPFGPTRGSESIITPSAPGYTPVSLSGFGTSDHVTINGFEITGPVSEEAIYCGVVGASDLNIKFNYIHDIGVDRGSQIVKAINYRVETSNPANINISDNIISDVLNTTVAAEQSGLAIWVNYGGSLGGCSGIVSNMTIARNTIRNIYSGRATKSANGINISVGMLYPGYGDGTGRIDNLSIVDNEIHHIVGGLAYGVRITGETPGAIIQRNSIHDVSGLPEDPDLAYGLIVTDANPEDPTIIPSMHVNHNSFTGVPCAVSNEATAALDATSCWWGSSRQDKITPLISGNVTWAPYLLSPLATICVDATWTGTGAMTDLAMSQTIRLSDSTSISVDHTPVMGVTAFATIQEGIDAANPGGAVLVAAGDYDESISIAKSIAVIGPKTGTTDRGTGEANIYTSGYGHPVAIQSDGVVFSGFQVTEHANNTVFYGINARVPYDAGNPGTWGDASLDDVEISHNYVVVNRTDVAARGMVLGEDALGDPKSDVPFEVNGLVLDSNLVQGPADMAGAKCYGVCFSTGTSKMVTFNDPTISNNKTVGDFYAAYWMGGDARPENGDGSIYVSGLLFTQNTMIGNQDGFHMVKLYDSTFTNNTATDVDRAFFAEADTATFTGNIITDVPAGGCGFYFYGAGGYSAPNMVDREITLTGNTVAPAAGAEPTAAICLTSADSPWVEPDGLSGNTFTTTYGVVIAGGGMRWVGFAGGDVIREWPAGSGDLYDTSGRSYDTIVDALTAAVAGDTIVVAAGLYAEDLTIDKYVTISGAGSSEVTLSGGIQLKASGLDADNPLTVEGMTITNTGGFCSGCGITIASQTLANLLFSDLVVTNSNLHGLNIGYSTVSNITFEDCSFSDNWTSASAIGFRIDKGSDVDGLTLRRCRIHHNHNYGLYTQHDKSPSYISNNVNNASFVDCEVTDNGYKGMVFEKLSNATFDSLVVRGNGNDSAVVTALHPSGNYYPAGLELNLKYSAFENITFNNLVASDNGNAYDPLRSDGERRGQGVAIKARDDGSTYGVYPASLDSCEIIGGEISNSYRGLVFGELGLDTGSMTGLSVIHVTFSGNKLVNLLNDLGSGISVTAVDNWWGTPRATDAAATILGTVSWAPYLLNPIASIVVDDAWATPSRWAPEGLVQTIRRSAGESFTVTHTPEMGVTGFGTLADALSNALPSQVIYVAPGSYGLGDTVWQVNQAQTIVGPQAGVDPTENTRTNSDAEAVLNGGILVNADVSDTAFGGLTMVYDQSISILGESDSIYLNNNASDVLVYHNILLDPDFDLSVTPPWGTQKGIITSSTGLSGLTTYQNSFSGYESGIYVNPNGEDVVIDGNAFTDCKMALRAKGTAGLAITGNTIEAFGGLALGSSAGWNPDGDPSTDVTLTDNSFFGLEGTLWYYIELTDGNINGTGVLVARENNFGGVPVASMTPAQYDALQLAVTDRNDDPSYSRLLFQAFALSNAAVDPDKTVGLKAQLQPGVAGVSVSFSVAGEAVGTALTDASGTATLPFFAAMAPNDYPIAATSGTFSDDATLTVRDVRGATVTLTISSVDSGPLAAGSSRTFTSRAYDAYGKDWDATAGTNFYTPYAAQGEWTSATTYKAERAGSWKLTGAYEDVYEVIDLVVTPGPTESLTIAPGSATIATGGTLAFSAIATDEFDNSWDATTTALFQVDSGSGGFSGNVYTAGGAADTVHVSATLDSKASNQATITVDSGTVPEAGDALRIDLNTGSFVIGTTAVNADGWYNLGTSGGAQVFIDLTVEDRVTTASITWLDADGGDHDNASLLADNALQCLAAYRFGVLTSLRQTSVVDGTSVYASYNARSGLTTITEGETSTSLSGIHLLTHVVYTSGAIAQGHIPAP
jgi:nitrous oxidase accessory protein NosD